MDAGDWWGIRIRRRNPRAPEPLYAMGLPGPMRLVHIANWRDGPESIPSSDRLRPILAQESGNGNRMSSKGESQRPPHRTG
jgi:hypothetical protein